MTTTLSTNISDLIASMGLSLNCGVGEIKAEPDADGGECFAEIRHYFSDEEWSTMSQIWKQRCRQLKQNYDLLRLFGAEPDLPDFMVGKDNNTTLHQEFSDFVPSVVPEDLSPRPRRPGLRSADRLYNAVSQASTKLVLASDCIHTDKRKRRRVNVADSSTVLLVQLEAKDESKSVEQVCEELLSGLITDVCCPEELHSSSSEPELRLYSVTRAGLKRRGRRKKSRRGRPPKKVQKKNNCLSHQRMPPTSKLAKLRLQRSTLQREDGSTAFACQFCEASFDLVQCLERHEREVHRFGIATRKPEAKFECKICGSIFKRKYHMERHVRFVHAENRRRRGQIHRKYCCSFCPRSFIILSQLRRHELEHHTDENSLACDKQPSEFDIFDPAVFGLRRRPTVFHRGDPRRPHRVVLHPRNLSNVELLSKYRRKMRSRSRHLLVGRQLRCSRCFKLFQEVRKKFFHESIHACDKPRRCDSCGVVFKLQACLTLHQRRQHLVHEFRCPFCSLVLHKGKDFREHVPTCPYKGAPAVPRNVCAVCGKVFRDSDALRRHRFVHIKIRPHLCEQCGKAFKSPKDLRNHMTAVHSDRLHLCSYCNKSFKSGSAMRTHRLTHIGEPPLECQFCNKKFYVKAIMDRHIITHSGEKPFICRGCGTPFARISHLKRHEYEVHGTVDGTPIAPKFPCTVCGAALKRKDHLVRHMKSVHADGQFGGVIRTKKKPPEVVKLEELVLKEKPPKKSSEPAEKTFLCQFCGALFGAQFRLNRHQANVHGFGAKKESTAINSVGQYDCKLCGRLFKCKKYLQQHEACVHSIEGGQPLQSNVQFMCQTCGKAFKCKVYLLKHQKAVHGIGCGGATGDGEGRRPQLYTCETCGAMFKRRDYLLKHVTHTHKDIQDLPIEGDAGPLPNKTSEAKTETEVKAEASFVVAYPTATISELPPALAEFFQAVNLPELSAHEDSTSEPISPSVCSFCGKAFSRPVYLQRHERDFHSSGKAGVSAPGFKCDICGKSFKRNQHLTRHYDQAHGSALLVNIPPTNAAPALAPPSKKPRKLRKPRVPKVPISFVPVMTQVQPHLQLSPPSSVASPVVRDLPQQTPPRFCSIRPIHSNTTPRLLQFGTPRTTILNSIPRHIHHATIRPQHSVNQHSHATGSSSNASNALAPHTAAAASSMVYEHQHVMGGALCFEPMQYAHGNQLSAVNNFQLNASHVQMIQHPSALGSSGHPNQAIQSSTHGHSATSQMHHPPTNPHQNHVTGLSTNQNQGPNQVANQHQIRMPQIQSVNELSGILAEFFSNPGSQMPPGSYYTLL